MLERWTGCLVGLAAGDALGAAVEFMPPGMFEPLDGLRGGGPFNLEPGQWTDDTSMALCLAESLIACAGFDPADQMRRYVRWYRTGYFSSTGRYFDSGRTIREALWRFEKTGEPYSGDTDEWSAGNGSLMRLAAVPMLLAHDPQAAIERAGDSSRTTHGARAAVDACRYLAGLIAGALTGVDKAALLAPRYAPIPGYWQQNPLAAEIDEIAAGSFRQRNPPEIEGTGYVVRSLEAALWAVQHSANFRDGCLLAVNLGHDADTTAAIYGQLAGAIYGLAAIPAEWRSQLTLYPTIIDFATKLHALAIANEPPGNDSWRLVSSLKP